MADENKNYVDTASALSALFQAYQQHKQQKQFSQSNADASAQASVAAIFRDYKNEALPQIYKLNNSTGAYNSSTAKLLANDAYAATVAKAASTVMAQKNAFGQLQNSAPKNNYSDVGKSLSVLLGQLQEYKKGLSNTNAGTITAADGSTIRTTEGDGPAAGFLGNYSDNATSNSTSDSDSEYDAWLAALTAMENP
jgi:hypothetical protein